MSSAPILPTTSAARVVDVAHEPSSKPFGHHDAHEDGEAAVAGGADEGVDFSLVDELEDVHQHVARRRDARAVPRRPELAGGSRRALARTLPRGAKPLVERPSRDLDDDLGPPRVAELLDAEVGRPRLRLDDRSKRADVDVDLGESLSASTFAKTNASTTSARASSSATISGVSVGAGSGSEGGGGEGVLTMTTPTRGELQTVAVHEPRRRRLEEHLQRVEHERRARDHDAVG